MSCVVCSCHTEVINWKEQCKSELMRKKEMRSITGRLVCRDEEWAVWFCYAVMPLLFFCLPSRNCWRALEDEVEHIASSVSLKLRRAHGLREPRYPAHSRLNLSLGQDTWVMPWVNIRLPFAHLYLRTFFIFKNKKNISLCVVLKCATCKIVCKHSLPD